MNLEDVASISGKPNIYKVIKPTRTGLILESIDETRSKFVASSKNKVSILKDISIYTYNSDSSVPLSDIFMKMYNTYGDDPGINAKADDDELKDFFVTVLPDYDEERVYPSDIKKVVKWYNQLIKYWPEKFKEEESSEDSGEEEIKNENSDKEGSENSYEGNANEEDIKDKEGSSENSSNKNSGSSTTSTSH